MRVSMGIFVRAVAVFVGLSNLAVLAWLNGAGYAIRRGDVTWEYALPIVLAVVVAGLVTAEAVVRGFGSSILSGRFFHQYCYVVLAVGLGGALTGGLVVYVLTIERVLVPGPSSVLGLILVAFIPGLMGAVFGFALGVMEGVILAFPLVTILRRLENGGLRSRTAAAERISGS